MAQTLSLNKVHDVRRDPQSGVRRLMGENHYISFRSGDGPTVFVQGGRAFSEGGPEMPTEQIPGWFYEQAKLVNADKAAKVGLDRLLERMNGAAEAEPQKPADEVNGTQERDPDDPQPSAAEGPTPVTDEKGIFTDDEGNRMYWCAECRKAIPSRQKGGHLMSVHKVGKR